MIVPTAKDLVHLIEATYAQYIKPNPERKYAFLFHPDDLEVLRTHYGGARVWVKVIAYHGVPLRALDREDAETHGRGVVFVMQHIGSKKIGPPPGGVAG